jgi:hypothetical protein
MQHNTLHGAEKSDYNKNQDLPNKKSSPPQAASAIISPIETLHNSTDTPPTTEPTNITPNDNDEIVDTEYFELPFLSPTVNRVTTSDKQPYRI